MARAKREVKPKKKKKEKVEKKKIEKKVKEPPIKKIKRDKKLQKAKQVENVLLVDPKKFQKVTTIRKIVTVIVDTFYEFAGITKVNGMYYLRRFVTQGFQRFLWSCIMLSLLSFAASMVYLLYRRFLDSPTRVIIAPPLGIHQIPFPGITICHPQNVMEYKTKEFVRKA